MLLYVSRFLIKKSILYQKIRSKTVLNVDYEETEKGI